MLRAKRKPGWRRVPKTYGIRRATLRREGPKPAKTPSSSRGTISAVPRTIRHIPRESTKVDADCPRLSSPNSCRSRDRRLQSGLSLPPIVANFRGEFLFVRDPWKWWPTNLRLPSCLSSWSAAYCSCDRAKSGFLQENERESCTRDHSAPPVWLRAHPRVPQRRWSPLLPE